MKKAKILLVIAATVLSACGQKDGSVSESRSTSNSGTYQTAPAMPEAAKVADTKNGGGRTQGGGGGGRDEVVTTQISLNQAENSQTPSVERKIVRNADLQLEADKPEDAQGKITSIAEGKGGFVVESQQSSSDARSVTRDAVTMTVRVPAEKFNEALEEIRKTASRVVVETVKADDVTEEFIDIEAQLKAKKSLEAQFLEIMKRAVTVEDALGVQRQLAEVRGEIEKIEGRKRFLENQAALSTIKIRLQTPTALTANSEGFGYRLKDAFGSGLDAALSFVLGLVAFAIAILPFLIFIVLPIYLVIRYFLKKRQKERTAREIVKEELKVE
ncbi:MAG TPA: DUF4349 domain-containing protein [Pyrinomonadaceae bacterium]|jgi:hypothetical protein